MTTITRNTELRKLPEATLFNLATILEVNNDWQKVVALIPKDLRSEHFEPKFNSEHIRLMEEHARNTNRKFAEVLFDEWGTSGRVRPTLGCLMTILLKAQTYRAVEEIARILREPPPEDEPAANNIELLESTESSLGSLIDIYNSTTSSVSSVASTNESNSVQAAPTQQVNLVACGNQSVSNISRAIDQTILADKKLVHFSYKELEALTNQFSKNFDPSGPVGKIGSGGFGEVYVGTHSKHGHLAIKKPKNNFQVSYEKAIIAFNTEVKSLSHLQHENIVPIFGYSVDVIPCIVCEYIDGGSLLRKIAARVLTEDQRIKIMAGTAQGLKYIHHTERPPQPKDTRKSYYLHGDIKSANILLTKDCVAKLCDFGMAKQLETTIFTANPSGTRAYMSPECLKGTVTQKNDIYSFGIVLLEILTGLEPIIKMDNIQWNIQDYVEEHCVLSNDDISGILDNIVEHWTQAQNIFKLAQNCLEDKRKRPTIDAVCNDIDQIYCNFYNLK